MTMTTAQPKANLDKEFFEEYTANDAILKYTKATAGHGISYLLDHDYKDVYMDALAKLPSDVKTRGIRLLEFGCGGGMNLVHLVSVLARQGYKIDRAVGTDFSPVLVESAKREAKNYLRPEEQSKLEFYQSRTEEIVAGLAKATNADSAKLAGTFDFIFGVNTIRYCHHFGVEDQAARELLALLKPGGMMVNIDMNDRFPLFKSDVKNKLRSIKEEECYIPPLEEYAAPFRKAGFEMQRVEHFCWISHSAGSATTLALRALTPVLNVVCKSRAMRSLIVARKPAK
jgi:SAM-dependent methyltransferase